jgi:Chaperone of endosialidase
MSNTTTTILMVAVGICLVLSVYPNRVDLLTPKPQLPKQEVPFTYTAGLNEQMMIGCANGMIFQQGAQAIDVNPTDIRFMANQEALRITQSGNIGIGTTNPTSKLHVIGDMILSNSNLKMNSGNLLVSGGSKIGIGTTNPASVLHVHGSNLIMTNGKLGIGTTDPQDTLSLPSDATVNLGGVVTKKNATTQQVETYLYGNIGIGTMAPEQPFQICADGNSTSSSYDNHTLSLKSTSGGSNPMQILIDADAPNQCAAIQSIKTGVSVMPLLLNPRGGNVGIGTTNPTDALTVAGTIKADRFHIQTNTFSFNQASDNNKWFKFASFAGITYGEFLLSWATDGEHGEVRFNVACSYNQFNTINIVGGTLYNALFDYIRIAVDNSSIYNTNYIEVHARTGNWNYATCDLNITLLNTGPISGGLAIMTTKTDGTSSGYTYYGCTPISSFQTMFNSSKMLFNGNLGINMDIPEYTVDVATNGTNVMRLTSSTTDTCLDLVNTGSGGNPWRIGSSSNGSGAGSGNFYIYGYGSSNSGLKMTIRPSGFVGIGTNDPSSRLELFGSDVLTVRNPAGGESWAGMRLNNDVGYCYWFLNSSTRSGDGGANLATLRNDAGRLRLQNAAGQSTIMLDGGSTTISAGGVNLNAGITVNGTSTFSSALTVNGAAVVNGPMTVGGSGVTISAPTTINGAMTVTGSSFTANAPTTITGNTVINGSWFTSNCSNSLNGTTWVNGRLIIQNSTNGGSSRGIWLWNAGDANWGIYMATSGAGCALNDGTAPAGNGFSAHSVRFRAYASNDHGFIFENSSNQMVASIRAGDGYSYFPQISTNSVTANSVYTSDWFRVNGGGGIHWENYGQGIQPTGNGCATFGTVSTYGNGRNGWYGWSIHDFGCFMSNGDVVGIHRNGKGWVIRGDSGAIYIGSSGAANSYMPKPVSASSTDASATDTQEEFVPAKDADTSKYAPVTGYSSIHMCAHTVFENGFDAKLGATISGDVHVTGNMGIRMKPNYPLDVNGSIKVNGYYMTRSWYMGPSKDDSQFQFFNKTGHVSSILNNGSMWRSADSSTNMQAQPLNISSSVKKIMGLQPVSYVYKNSPDQARSIGFVAQQVQAVNPYCISEQECVVEQDELDEDGKPIPAKTEDGFPIFDEDGFVTYKKKKIIKDKKLGIVYEDLYIHAINVIKAHHTILESQDSTLASLEQQTLANQSYIQNLSDRLARLEQLVRA